MKHQHRSGKKVLLAIAAFLGLSLGSPVNAHALEIDWSGQFWTEFNYIHDYPMDLSNTGSTVDATRTGAGGYYVQPAGNQDAGFQSLFLRVRPKVIVNDNIYIKSEWWVGDPIFGIFGSGLPYSTDQKQFYSSQSRGALLSAQRLWAEFVTDIGTFQVGRIPLQWGLGVVWNSGDALWSRYMSTGDALRWVAKFGSFTFAPGFIINSAGNNIGGSCTVTGATTCNTTYGQGGVTDYSIVLKYENLEDELEGGVNVIKRLGGSTQDPNGGMLTPPQPNTTTLSAGAMNFVIYDFFARKKFNKVSIAGEVPLVSGTLGSSNYQTVALAGEIDWKPSETWEFLFKSGYAPGQPNQGSASIDTFRAFYFHPNYHIGMIMFNYQLANFVGPQTQNNATLSAAGLKSPYDNPITDAAYFSLSTQIKPWDKWTLRPGLV